MPVFFSLTVHCICQGDRSINILIKLGFAIRGKGGQNVLSPTGDMLTCHSGKTGVNNKINDV